MKVLLIGDYCTDVFIEGDVDRLSPEVPVPVFVETSRKETPGMAGNVLANLESLCPGILVETWFPMQRIRKTRYVDRKTGHHFLRVDDERARSPSVCGPIIEDYDALVVSDYNKGYLDSLYLEEIHAHCVATDTPLFIDTKRILENSWAQKAMVKINEREYQKNREEGVGDHPENRCQTMIVTKGGEGMTLYQNGLFAWSLPAIPIQVRDGAGCGDTVLAALVVRYLENGGDVRGAMEWAGKAGAVAVSKRGVVAVNREEVG